VTVLVISHPTDTHTIRVIDAIARLGCDAALLDVADLPEKATITIDYADPGNPAATWTSVGSAPVPAIDASAVWWRRPQHPSIQGISDPDALGFVHGEWHEATRGLFQLLDCPWMNPPACDDRASRKAAQLRVASRLGFRIPDTMMTSDAAAASAFVARHGIGNVVYKIFAATHQVWRETRLLTSNDLDRFDSLHLAPVIFQEYVPACEDIRVTIVGRQLFAMAIQSRGTSYEVDFRVSLREARTAPTTLPTEVQAKLFGIMDEFGLVYGAFDLRLTDNGTYVFLEVNPAGEFLFCEVGAGLPITDAVAQWLAGSGDGSQSHLR
jgi:glutathione synthase/RimK-type ligase-like ATP-grasp enzyme